MYRTDKTRVFFYSFFFWLVSLCFLPFSTKRWLWPQHLCDMFNFLCIANIDVCFLRCVVSFLYNIQTCSFAWSQHIWPGQFFMIAADWESLGEDVPKHLFCFAGCILIFQSFKWKKSMRNYVEIVISCCIKTCRFYLTVSLKIIIQYCGEKGYFDLSIDLWMLWLKSGFRFGWDPNTGD